MQNQGMSVPIVKKCQKCGAIKKTTEIKCSFCGEWMYATTIKPLKEDEKEKVLITPAHVLYTTYAKRQFQELNQDFYYHWDTIYNKEGHAQYLAQSWQIFICIVKILKDKGWWDERWCLPSKPKPKQTVKVKDGNPFVVCPYCEVGISKHEIIHGRCPLCKSLIFNKAAKNIDEVMQVGDVNYMQCGCCSEFHADYEMGYYQFMNYKIWLCDDCKDNPTFDKYKEVTEE